MCTISTRARFFELRNIVQYCKIEQQRSRWRSSRSLISSSRSLLVSMVRVSDSVRDDEQRAILARQLLDRPRRALSPTPRSSIRKKFLQRVRILVEGRFSFASSSSSLPLSSTLIPTCGQRLKLTDAEESRRHQVRQIAIDPQRFAACRTRCRSSESSASNTVILSSVLRSELYAATNSLALLTSELLDVLHAHRHGLAVRR